MKRFILIFFMLTIAARASAQCVAVSIAGQPQSQTVASDNNATFNVTAAGTGPFSYFWFKDGVQIVGAISATYTKLNVTAADAGTYYCKVTNCSSLNEAITNNALLTVSTSCIPVSIVAQPQPLIAAPGSSATFTVAAAGTGPFSYFWFKDGVQIAGAISATYGKLNLTAADVGNYYCKVTNCSSVNEAISNNAYLNINTACTPVSIATQPQSQAATIGSNVNFTVAVNGDGPFSYFWFKDGVQIAGAISATYGKLNLTAADAGNYYCKVTNCSNLDEAITNNAVLTVNTACTPVAITSQPAAVTAVAGGSATFQIAVSGDGPFRYFWYKDGVQIVGAMGPVYTRLNLGSSDAGYYNCVVTNCNSTQEAITSPAQLTVGSNTAATYAPPQTATQSNGQQYTAAEPIQLGTGSYAYSHSFLKLPVIRDTLKFSTCYNSLNQATDGPLGYGWSHALDYRVAVSRDSLNLFDVLWTVHYPDGHLAYFIPLNDNSGTSKRAFAGTRDSLVRNSGGDFSLFGFDNRTYHFTAAGLPDQFSDLNGNVTVFTYNGQDLASVTGPGGRKFNFSYANHQLISVSDPLGRSCGFSYDSNGNLQKATDANGNSTLFAYDNSHRLTNVTLPSGHTLVANTYDAVGRVIAQSDAYNASTAISYDSPAKGDATVTNPDQSMFTVHHDSAFRKTYRKDEMGYSQQFTYDSWSNENSFTDENGKLLKHVYDTKGNLLLQTARGGGMTRVTYNLYHSPLSLTDPNGNVTTYTYDSQNNLLAIHYPDNSSRSFSYDPQGELTLSRDDDTNVTVYIYSPQGDLLSLNTANGSRFFSYDAAGRRTTLIDEDSDTTRTAYDANDNILSLTDPLGHVSIYTYDSADRMLSLTDPDGNQSSFSYDDKERLIAQTNALNGQTTYSYDLRDNLLSANDAANVMLSYVYDPKNRRISTTNALGTTSLAYDGAGNILQQTDGDQVQTSYTYTSDGLIQTRSDGLKHTTSYAYDANGNRIKVTDPLNQSTVYRYDPMNRLAGITDALKQVTSISYDGNGNRSSVSDPNGHVQTYQYDAVNRLFKVTDPAGNQSQYNYDPAGNLLQRYQPNGSITKTYDAANRPVSMTYSSGQTYSFTYDKAGHTLTMQTAAGRQTYTYNALGEVSSYTDPFGNLLGYSYDAAGNKTRLTYPGGKTVSYSRDGAGNLKTVKDWLNHTFQYNYDAAGRQVQLQYPNGTLCSRGYDGAGNLLSLSNALNTQPPFAAAFFTLDADGNRVSEQHLGALPVNLSPGHRPYTYNSADMLLKDSVLVYTNDAQGNRLSQSGSSSKVTYSFSAADQLTSLTGASGQKNTFSYDADGIRLTATRGTTSSIYVTDNSGALPQVLQLTDAAGKLRAQFVYGDGLLENIDSLGTPSYDHFDGAHNTVAITNSQGSVTDSYSYDPFGMLLSHNGQNQQPFTFLGEFGVQQETPALYYIRQRYYDATAGRFLSRDPQDFDAQNPQAINRYAYALNEPVRHFDNTGLYQNQDQSPQQTQNQDHGISDDTYATVSGTALDDLSRLIGVIEKNPGLLANPELMSLLENIEPYIPVVGATTDFFAALHEYHNGEITRTGFFTKIGISGISALAGVLIPEIEIPVAIARPFIENIVVPTVAYSR